MNKFKLVPVEPDEGMLAAARVWSYMKYGKPIGDDAATGCYAAMIEAAPEVSAEELDNDF